MVCGATKVVHIQNGMDWKLEHSCFPSDELLQYRDAVSGSGTEPKVGLPPQSWFFCKFLQSDWEYRWQKTAWYAWDWGTLLYVYEHEVVITSSTLASYRLFTTTLLHQEPILIVKPITVLLNPTLLTNYHSKMSWACAGIPSILQNVR